VYRAWFFAKIRGVRVEEYAYYVNKLPLKTWIWRQIVTSQTAHTKYKSPAYVTDLAYWIHFVVHKTSTAKKLFLTRRLQSARWLDDLQGFLVLHILVSKTTRREISWSAWWRQWSKWREIELSSRSAGKVEELGGDLINSAICQSYLMTYQEQQQVCLPLWHKQLGGTTKKHVNQHRSNIYWKINWLLVSRKISQMHLTAVQARKMFKKLEITKLWSLHKFYIIFSLQGVVHWLVVIFTHSSQSFGC